MRIEH